MVLSTCMETVLMIANKDLTIINEIMNKYNVENPKKYWKLFFKKLRNLKILSMSFE